MKPLLRWWISFCLLFGGVGCATTPSALPVPTSTIPAATPTIFLRVTPLPSPTPSDTEICPPLPSYPNAVRLEEQREFFHVLRSRYRTSDPLPVVQQFFHQWFSQTAWTSIRDDATVEDRTIGKLFRQRPERPSFDLFVKFEEDPAGGTFIQLELFMVRPGDGFDIYCKNLRL